jgi:hypothetical protein
MLLNTSIAEFAISLFIIDLNTSNGIIAVYAPELISMPLFNVGLFNFNNRTLFFLHHIDLQNLL